jgi:hypothetical protein
MSTRLVQLKNGNRRQAALVEEPHLRLLDAESVYSLAEIAIGSGAKLSNIAKRAATTATVAYEDVYTGDSEWKLLPPIDHPEPTRCLVSGTGLTHFGSARDRQAMHAAITPEQFEELTDSMKMFRWGVDGGRPPTGSIGTSPEWFYKGTGAILRAHGEALQVPAYAEDGGEEAEVVAIYVISPDGAPCRLGMAVGNEFSDHCFEKKNYLNLASSKLRNCSIGPELVLDPEFESVPGKVTVYRSGQVMWSKPIRTGEAEMCHSLQNIEHHHFKFETHRRLGDIHIHFLGADCLSFGEGVRLADGDVVQIEFEGFGRALRNSVRVDRASPQLITAASLG